MRQGRPGRPFRLSARLLTLLAFLLVFAQHWSLAHQFEHLLPQGQGSFILVPPLLQGDAPPFSAQAEQHCGGCLQIADLDHTLSGTPAADPGRLPAVAPFLPQPGSGTAPDAPRPRSRSPPQA